MPDRRHIIADTDWLQTPNVPDEMGPDRADPGYTTTPDRRGNTSRRRSPDPDPPGVGHQVSMQLRFFPVRGTGGGDERSASTIRLLDSAGSITSSIS